MCTPYFVGECSTDHEDHEDHAEHAVWGDVLNHADLKWALLQLQLWLQQQHIQGEALDVCCRRLQAGNEFCVVTSCAILAFLADNVPLFTAETAVF